MRKNNTKDTKKKIVKSSDLIQEDNKRAAELGLSYGKYIAMRDMGVHFAETKKITNE